MTSPTQLILLLFFLLHGFIILRLFLVKIEGPLNISSEQLCQFHILDYHNNPLFFFFGKLSSLCGKINNLPIEVAPVDRQTITWTWLWLRNTFVHLDDTVNIDDINWLAIMSPFLNLSLNKLNALFIIKGHVSREEIVINQFKEDDVPGHKLLNYLWEKIFLVLEHIFPLYKWFADDFFALSLFSNPLVLHFSWVSFWQVNQHSSSEFFLLLQSWMMD